MSPTINTDSQVSNRTRYRKWGLICMFLPALLLVLTVIVFFIVNALFDSQFGASSESTDIAPAAQFVNSALYYIGSFALFALIPGFIIGIIILVKKPKS